MPVIVGNKRSGQRKGQKLSLNEKLAKLAIADYWQKDSDGTRYYINAVNNDGRNYVRFRIDIPKADPITILLDPKTAMQLGMALQRAAFAAQVLRPEEVSQLWHELRGRGGQRAVKRQEAVNEQEPEQADNEAASEEEELPDVGFA